MNKIEAARLLTIAAGYDNRDVDDINTTAWQLALATWPYEMCEQAIVEHFTDPSTRHAYLTVGHLLDRLERIGRARVADIEADVRSAKARGIVEQDWGRATPLTPTAAAALEAARAADRQQAARYAPDQYPAASWEEANEAIAEQRAAAS